MEPIPVGTKVDYHGSLDYMHGVYEIDRHVDPASVYPQLSPEQLREVYPDGVAYSMWPVGVPRKFGNREKSLSRVKRGSITPVEEERGLNRCG